MTPFPPPLTLALYLVKLPLAQPDFQDRDSIFHAGEVGHAAGQVVEMLLHSQVTQDSVVIVRSGGFIDLFCWRNEKHKGTRSVSIVMRDSVSADHT